MLSMLMKRQLHLNKSGNNWYLTLRYKPKILHRIIIALVVVLALSAVLFVVHYQNTKYEQLRYTKGSINTWVNAFVDKRYSVCDAMVTNEKDRLLSSDQMFMGSNEASGEMYQRLLERCSDCISKVEVVAGEDGQYKIATTYRPVRKVESIQFDNTKMHALIQEYLDSEIKQKEFKARLKELYLESFDKTVLSEIENTEQTFEYILTENNMDKVVGVYDYVYQALNKMNLYANMQLYEDAIEGVMSQYVEAPNELT